MSQFNTPAYDIERPTGQCAFTARTLEPGEKYVATLVEYDEPVDPESKDKEKPKSAAASLGLKRLDVSKEAWDQGSRPDNLFSHWVTTVAEPNKKKKLFVDDAVLMNLLRRLADDERPQRIAFRFVLCLILMRKKLLRYDRTERRDTENEQGEKETQHWWVMTPKLDLSKGPLGKWNEEEMLEVFDPHLDEDQVQDVTEQLGEILDAEL